MNRVKSRVDPAGLANSSIGPTRAKPSEGVCSSAPPSAVDPLERHVADAARGPNDASRIWDQEAGGFESLPDPSNPQAPGSSVCSPRILTAT
jgi:hypothetical protein